MYQTNRPTCTNCGKPGHHYRGCKAPITSYGIIAFHTKQWNTLQHPLGKSETPLEFLLIQRRNSIGFIELIRCKFKPTDTEYILEQIRGTTEKERTMLRTFSFYDLWKEIWGKDSENKHYRSDYYQAKERFETLRETNLHALLDSVRVEWKTPEWGFPKGRRNPHETDEECAIREFCEETHMKKDDFTLIQNVKPIRETFTGNNQIRYEHVYFFALVPEKKDLFLDLRDDSQVQEIGNIGWFSYKDGYELIRSTTPEKRNILTQASLILDSVYPIISK